MDYATLLEGKQTAPTTLWKRVGRSRVTWAVLALALLVGGQGGLAFLAFGWGMILFPFLGKDNAAKSPTVALSEDSMPDDYEDDVHYSIFRNDVGTWANEDESGYRSGPFGFGLYAGSMKIDD